MRKIFSVLLVVTLVLSFSTIALAASNPAAESEWLASQGYTGIVYMGKIDDCSGKSMVVNVPEGANLIVVKGSSGDASLKVIQLTENEASSILVSSEGLSTKNGKNQPNISHVTFFKVDVKVTILKVWKDANGKEIAGDDSIVTFNNGAYKVGDNAVKYFGNYTITEDAIKGFTAEVATQTVAANGTVTFVNVQEDIVLPPYEDEEENWVGHTAVAMGSTWTMYNQQPWQAGYNAIDVDSLTADGITMPVIAGQFYNIGTVTVFKNAAGFVDVTYTLLDGAKIADNGNVKVGIYADAASAEVSNGQLRANQINSGTAYVRVHFDVMVDMNKITK